MLVDSIVRLFVVCDWGDGCYSFVCVAYETTLWSVVSVSLLPDITVRRG